MKQTTKIKIINLVKYILRFKEAPPKIAQSHTSPIQHLQFSGFVPKTVKLPKTYINTEIFYRIRDFIYETDRAKSPFHIEIQREGHFDPETIQAKWKATLHFISDEVYSKAAEKFIL